MAVLVHVGSPENEHLPASEPSVPCIHSGYFELAASIASKSTLESTVEARVFDFQIPRTSTRRSALAKRQCAS